MLTILTALIALGVVGLPIWMPLTAFVVPLLIGGLVLNIRWLAWLLIVVAIAMTAVMLAEPMTYVRLGAGIIVVVVGIVMLWGSRSRSALGVIGSRGESMLVDLRDRLLSQSELPDLPRAWYAEAVTRSAGGASFSGDFMVAAKTRDGGMLEVAVVDVSGKGLAAGTRSLLLSGAFGGLLGSLPPADFLPAANNYLLRQEWGEGFATAVHLALDLHTGAFEVRTAGHPPALQFLAGSGRWVVHESSGPILGVLRDAEFEPAKGQLSSGGALLLYTDGLVETPQRDISLGIDKLLGEAERLVTRGFDRGVVRLMDRTSSTNDDRALLMIHRR